LVILLHWNGAADKCPPFLAMAATDTTTSTSISKAKKAPASFVDTPTPRTVMSTAPPVSSTEKMIQGTFQPK